MMQGHSLREACYAAKDGRHIYNVMIGSWAHWDDHEGLLWKNQEPVRVCDATAEKWAIEGCTDGEDGRPCEWCARCPHVAGPDHWDYGEYVWFELEHKYNWLVAEVPFRHQRKDWNSQKGKLTHRYVVAHLLPSIHIPGFEVARFARRMESGVHYLMDRPWEPNVSMNAWNPEWAGRMGEFYNDPNIGSRGYLEGRLSEEQAGYPVATHVIMRRV